MKDKPKIAVIGLKGLPAFGGAAAVGESIIEQLKDKYKFTVYATKSHTNLKSGDYGAYEMIVFPKIPFKKINTLLYYILSAFHAILFRKYDLIHLHHKDAAFILSLLHLKNYKTITTLHGTRYTEKWKKFDFYLKKQEGFLLNKKNTITSVSPIIYSEKLNSSSKEIIYIPNGINLPSSSEIKIIKSKDYILFAAGRIVPSKGCHLLLKAAKKIGLKSEIIIIGDLDQMPDYKKELLELSKDLNVKFIGLIKNKKELLGYLKNAKLFVYPSNTEAMSMMMLEVLSVKTPLVCADIEENKLILTENEVTFFTTDDVLGLTEKIIWALSHNNEINSKAELAYFKLKEKYLWSNIAKEYEKLFDQTIAK